MRSTWIVAGLVLGCAACGGSTSSDATAGGGDFFKLARGSYLIQDLIDCGGCHTADPTRIFGGGVKFPIDGNGHYVYSRNLTSDPATGMKLTEEQFIRVLQTGEDFTNHGQVLVVMPWPNLRWLTTDDMKSLYAVLKVLPPAVNEVPPDNKGPFAAVPPVPMPAEYDEGEEVRPLPTETIQLPFAPPGTTSPVPDPGHAERGAAILPVSYAKMPRFYTRSAEEQLSFGRGSYLVNAALCSECHTNRDGLPRILTPGPSFLKVPADSYLTGGAVFSLPAPLNPILKQTRTMSANLIGPSGFFNEPDMTVLLFDAIIYAMAHVDDTPPLPLGWPMPADHFRNLGAQDLADIYSYMRILAEDYDHTGQVDKETQPQARYCTGSADCDAAAHETCFVDGSADKAVNNQCVGGPCATDADCAACQKCVGSLCQQPAAGDACLAAGL